MTNEDYFKPFKPAKTTKEDIEFMKNVKNDEYNCAEYIERPKAREINFTLNEQNTKQLFKAFFGEMHSESVENKDGTFTHRLYADALDAEIVEDILGSEFVE